MCYYLSHNEQPRRATRNMRVYKVLFRKGDFYIAPIHTDCRYLRGATSPVVKMTPKGDGCTMQWIEEGYHFYTSQAMAECRVPVYAWEQSFCVCAFVIPKGTLYYINRKEEIGVAEQIKML